MTSDGRTVIVRSTCCDVESPVPRARLVMARQYPQAPARVRCEQCGNAFLVQGSVLLDAENPGRHIPGQLRTRLAERGCQ